MNTLSSVLPILDHLSLPWFFLVSVAAIGLAMEIGFRLGRWRRKKESHEKESPVSAVVGAILGLAGFMIAVTFGIGVSRFEEREKVFLAEVDAIASTFLEADFLDEPIRSSVKNHLREYVDVRLAAVRTGKLDVALTRSLELHRLLWASAVQAEKTHETRLGVSLFIESLTHVIELHTKRVTVGVRSRIPPMVWIILYGIALLGLAEIGYHTALSGSSRTPTGVGLVLAFAAILTLMTDLDRPREGVIRVSQRAMEDLRVTMEQEKP